MTAATLNAPTPSAGDLATVVRPVTVIMGTVAGLILLFGFGAVLNLACAWAFLSG